MSARSRCFCAIANLLVLLPCAANAAAEVREARVWDVVEIELTAERDLAKPYVDGLPDQGAGYVTVVFRGTEGEAKGKEYKLTGFWDGARQWKVRFAPPVAGTWTYRSTSRDPGLDGKQGTIECRAWSEAEKQENATRRGLVRVCRTGPRPGRYFEYADGTPMLWLGDTWWNWTKRGIRFESFQRLADDRAAKGFTVGQLFFAGNGWGRPSSLLDRTYANPDLEHIRSVERMIRYANSKGITVWIHGWWARPQMKSQIGEENLRRWWRYVVHRLGAYNVIWVVAGEYNMHNYGGMGLDFWKGLGQMIDREDPYDRIIGVHPTPPAWSGGAEAPQWSTAEVLHGEPWLDYNQSQPGHGRWRNELIPSIVEHAYRQQPAKPIVVTEPWYEFIQGNPTAADIRFGTWSAILSGAAGHSYGGGHVWKAHVPEAPAGKDSWPMELGFETNTLDYPGAKSLGFMAKFLKSIDWWRLQPHPEMVLENPSRYCSAMPGELYLVYLRWGGAVKLDLRPSSPEDQFEYRWLDLAADKAGKASTVQGGGVREFQAPGDYPAPSKDWVLHVTRKPAGKAKN